GSVALHDHSVRTYPIERLANSDEDTSTELVQRLIFFHQVKIDVRRDLHELEDLIQHLAMLSCDAHGHLHRILGLQLFHNRKKLNGLRPRSEQNKYALTHPGNLLSRTETACDGHLYTDQKSPVSVSRRKAYWC